MEHKTEPKDNWDPLSSETGIPAEIVGATLKREIKNIIKSYTGWFDPLSELIQNALDAVDKRKQDEKEYQPQLWVEINLRDNYVCVTDNGIGFKEVEFRNFLKPNVSFKGGGSRGDKGVGATYLAYGFNYLQFGTKTPDFTYIGELSGGREWIEDDRNVIPRPTVKFSRPISKAFEGIDRGSTFCLKFLGKNIRPQNLSWFGATLAEQWATVLRMKTPLGGVYPHGDPPKTSCHLSVVDMAGNLSQKEMKHCTYLYPHEVIPACADLREMIEKQKELADKGKPTKLPDVFNKLTGIYSFWNYKDIISQNSPLNPRLDDGEKELLERYQVCVYGFVTYSTDVWDEFNDDIVKLRKGERILRGGLQLATNGMPQGELILIPLTHNIYYQNTSHVVVHFSLAEPDLGRKGFQPELKTLAEKISVTLVALFLDWRTNLKTPTGAPRQIIQDKQIHEWKKETEDHETKEPLLINRQDVFLPMKEISLTAKPVVEQDVIVLFNQLLAGGVIRGIKLMSASQYKTYDGLWRAYLKKPFENYVYEKDTNPLGIQQAALKEFITAPYILEYKYSFDALLEDIEKGDKDEGAIDLVVCWEMGDKWKRRYAVTPLLLHANLHHREIHGVTHIIRNATTGQSVFWAVVLSELVDYINNPNGVQEYQKKKYVEA
jgi:hypothetical protein